MRKLGLPWHTRDDRGEQLLDAPRSELIDRAMDGDDLDGYAHAISCEKRLSESMGEQGQKVDHPTPQEAWDNRVPIVPLKVGGLQPDDISPTAVFLASDAANMVTGTEFEVTGADSAKDI